LRRRGGVKRRPLGLSQRKHRGCAGGNIVIMYPFLGVADLSLLPDVDSMSSSPFTSGAVSRMFADYISLLTVSMLLRWYILCSSG
jgi:hypothetical protein